MRKGGPVVSFVMAGAPIRAKRGRRINFTTRPSISQAAQWMAGSGAGHDKLFCVFQKGVIGNGRA
jgi:hypothetical protein